ncbi:MAG TPA: lysophospholipid acyltransferase family protein [Syntrophales bacterium]|nr:lysophospholipid acyltransferase family protein [Syntrophales bacterium]HOL59170.1 lysophospholipid acyltransferase family protein [Syntrophales bacterium]HPO35749.1 lysophospholipid acyltransferase family protein [Syntrophales bacterium]
MFRSAVLILIGVLITAYLSFTALFMALVGGTENSIHKLARLWARIILFLSGVKVEVKGVENVLSDRPQIFMSNHQSGFDIFIVLAFVPGQFRWIAKKELFRIPVFSQAMKTAGYIEIDRQNHEKAMESLKIAAQKIREGKSVMSFPEGTRSRDGRIKAFKQGMFHLALQAGVPIVPITIIGASEIMPKRKLRINPGKITMVIDKPIDVSPYTPETRHELITRVRQVIVDNFNRWRKEGTPPVE